MENTITAAYVAKQMQKGEAAEKFFGDYLAERGWDIVYTTGYNTDWDLTATKDNIPITFEVKLNGNPEEWGTVFVETEQGEKPSGLKKTKADWQIHISKDSGVIKGIRTRDLIDFITWKVSEGKLTKVHNKFKDSKGRIAGSGYKIDWNMLTKISK